MGSSHTKPEDIPWELETPLDIETNSSQILEFAENYENEFLEYVNSNRAQDIYSDLHNYLQAARKPPVSDVKKNGWTNMLKIIKILQKDSRSKSLLFSNDFFEALVYEDLFKPDTPLAFVEVVNEFLHNGKIPIKKHRKALLQKCESVFDNFVEGTPLCLKNPLAIPLLDTLKFILTRRTINEYDNPNIFNKLVKYFMTALKMYVGDPNASNRTKKPKELNPNGSNDQVKTKASANMLNDDSKTKKNTMAGSNMPLMTSNRKEVIDKDIIIKCLTILLSAHHEKIF